jgi:hypothetical protein
VVLAYIEAWNTPDEQARRGLLDRCWAENGTYTDSISEVHSKEALIGPHRTVLGRRAVRWRTRAPYPRQQRRRASSRDDPLHLGIARLAGRCDISRTRRWGLAADGRLQRITGFFGPPPPIQDGWPDNLVWHGD